MAAMRASKSRSEGRLRVRSQEAWDLAHRLARDQNRPIKSVVESALDFYARQNGHLDILDEVDRPYPKKPSR